MHRTWFQWHFERFAIKKCIIILFCRKNVIYYIIIQNFNILSTFLFDIFSPYLPSESSHMLSSLQSLVFHDYDILFFFFNYIKYRYKNYLNRSINLQHKKNYKPKTSGMQIVNFDTGSKQNRVIKTRSLC